ncbi:hypothetical protein TREMEDRAFT_56147 [Tremella mesenterica DSM 1558]|nr:uncharacterized protein TREMEDRAFT_56147 [Tremella mesenterica DSM 1558]EIW73196.1 hypothetical protein TREMEDRAFT_56147 [Tremella mesenterica DSM 1558]
MSFADIAELAGPATGRATGLHVTPLGVAALDSTPGSGQGMGSGGGMGIGSGRAAAVRMKLEKMLQIKEDMTDEQRREVIAMIKKQTSKLPSSSKKALVAKVIETKLWDEVEPEEKGMVKDLTCSVCHDEYEPDSLIGVTPCKHMYHQECLDTWFSQPNIASCPMCRRDLAALPIMIRFVWSKNKDDALALWMA